MYRLTIFMVLWMYSFMCLPIFYMDEENPKIEWYSVQNKNIFLQMNSPHHFTQFDTKYMQLIFWKRICYSLLTMLIFMSNAYHSYKYHIRFATNHCHWITFEFIYCSKILLLPIYRILHSWINYIYSNKDNFKSLEKSSTFFHLKKIWMFYGFCGPLWLLWALLQKRCCSIGRLRGF